MKTSLKNIDIFAHQDQNELIEYLMSNRTAFDEFVYTPWREAVAQLKIRENNIGIEHYLKQTLKGEVPLEMKKGKAMVLGRHVATPNYEMHRFVMCADVLNDLKPIVFEYLSDKYTDYNSFKSSLNKLCFYRASYNSKHPHIEYINILENISHKKTLKEVRTKWGESLVNFHHDFFHKCFNKKDIYLFDSSEWLTAQGLSAKDYYKSYLSLFLKHGILFENFIFSKQEQKFTKEIVLPTLLLIRSLTGMKPLIVALEPTDVEEDRFWFSYPPVYKEFVDTFI